MKTWQWRTFFFICTIATVFFARAEPVKHPLATVPAGEFKPFWLTPIGKNKKTRAVKIESFQAMVKAVTVGDFRDFLASHPDWQKENVSPLFVEETYLNNLKSAKLSAAAPMTTVSWFVAKAYCENAHMRLPTTNEWEYMAAASEAKINANEDAKFLRRILDWYGEPQAGDLKEVGHIYKNMYGLWDMHGLIWEWVDDFNSNFVTGESREDSSFNKDLFCGSGSMAGANKQDYAAFMRFAFRASLKGRSTIWNLGFRCVR
jgi:formylglycine-generating enzyme